MTIQPPIMQNKARQSNFELLRILAMVAIIANHFSLHSGFAFAPGDLSLQRFYVQLLQLGGKVGVNLFVMISGYFLIHTTSIKLSKILKLWGQVIFYSVTIFAVLWLTGNADLGLKQLVKHALPITFEIWWFASVYFVLYLVSPYLNRLAATLTGRQYVGMLALFTLCWSVIPTLSTMDFQGNGLIWFSYLYLLGGFLRRYGHRISLQAGMSLLLGSGILLLTFLSAVVFDILGTKWGAFASHATYFFSDRKVPVVLASVLIFYGVSKLDMGCRPAINRISGAMFGVYLIHDHLIMRTVLWQDIFSGTTVSGLLVVPYSLLCIVLVFVVCTAIDMLRHWMFHRPGTWICGKVEALTAKAQALVKKRTQNPQ